MEPGKKNPPLALSRPYFLDYLILLIGIGVSAMLAEMTQLRAEIKIDDYPWAGNVWIQSYLRGFPLLVFLPLGIILFWPVFYITQWVTGRRQSLSAGEWLLNLAWIACLAFIGAILWQSNQPPDDDFKKYLVISYMILMASMGTVALIIWFIGMLGFWQNGWTHSLGLALILWPMIPLMGLWFLHIELK